MNYLNSKTFCASAWFSIRSDNIERFSPCCGIDCSKSKFDGKINYTLSDSFETWHNSEYMQYLRKELDSGEFPEECFQCRNAERHGLPSLRQSTNNTIANNSSNEITIETVANNLNLDEINNSWMSVFFHNKKDLTSDVVVSMDSMVSNFCNFECVMCFPHDSSKIKSRWEKNKTHPGLEYMFEVNPQFKDTSMALIKNPNAIETFRNVVNNQPLNFLHIRGGEPFIDNNVISTLEQLPIDKKKNIRLLFNSNCSVELTPVINKLKGFKDIIIIASLDGIGDTAEYVRKHCVWTETESSILNAIKNTDAIIKVHCTIHALNVLWINELEEWCDTHNLELTSEFVHRPDHLSLSAVPTEILQQASDKIKNKGIKGRIAEYKFSEELHKHLLNYVEFYNESSNTEFKDLLKKKGTEVPF